MAFKSSLDRLELADMVSCQLNNLVPDPYAVAPSMLLSAVGAALERVERNFSTVRLKYYRDGQTTLFDHLMSDHYCVFLYYLSNSLYRMGGDSRICTKLFMLNKYLHGVDMFYSIQLPDHFMVVHPLGSVFGNAVYGDYMVFYQTCTIGASIEGIYPTFEGSTVLYSGSAAIGKMTVGSDVIFAREANVINRDIEAKKIIFGASPNLILKENNKALIDTIFER